MEVVVRDRIPVDPSLGSPPSVLVRSAGSSGALIVAAVGGDRVLQVQGGAWSVIAPPDSLLRVSNLGVLGDSLWIADDAARRVLVLSGSSVRHREILTPTIQPHSQPHVLGLLAEGVVVVESRPAPPVPDTLVALIAAVGTGDAMVIDSVAEFGGEMRLVPPSGSPVVLFAQPWFYRDIPVITRNGYTLAILRQRPARPDQRSAIVEVHEHLRRQRRAPVQSLSLRPTALTNAVIESWLSSVMQDSLVRFLGGRQRAERELRAALFRPPHLPAIRRALSASPDFLFLERVTADTLHHWEIWQHGRRRGSFVLSPRISLQDIADSTIWAVTRGAPGVDTILVATVRKRSQLHSAR